MTNIHDRLTCSGFEISIKVDGIKSNTYSVQQTQGDEQASCWISSEADKEFSIVLCRKAFEEYDFTAEIFLDGHKAVYYVFKNETGRTSGPRTISCTRTSPTEVRKFAFGTLELTDDDAHLNIPSAHNIGEIKVLIQRVKTTSVLSGFAPKVFDVPNIAKVHERSKKGLTHRIQYGPAHQRSASHRSYKYERHGQPIIFIFNYRPLQMLQAAGHAPLLYSLSEEHVQERSSSPFLDPLLSINVRNGPHHTAASHCVHKNDTRNSSPLEKENIRGTPSSAHISRETGPPTQHKRHATEVTQTSKRVKTEVKTEPTTYCIPT